MSSLTSYLHFNSVQLGDCTGFLLRPSVLSSGFFWFSFIFLSWRPLYLHLSISRHSCGLGRLGFGLRLGCGCWRYFLTVLLTVLIGKEVSSPLLVDLPSLRERLLLLQDILHYLLPLLDLSSLLLPGRGLGGSCTSRRERGRDQSCLGLSFRYQLLVHLGLGHRSLVSDAVIKVGSKFGAHSWRWRRRRWRRGRWRTGTWWSWWRSRWSGLSVHQHFFTFSFSDEFLVHPGLGHHRHLTNTILADWGGTCTGQGWWRWWRWWGRSCRRRRRRWWWGRS